MIYPDSEQGKRKTSLKNNEVSGSYVRMARTVLEYAPALADNVLAGAPLNDSYEIAQSRKAGKLLKTMEKQHGGHAAKARSSRATEVPKTLADLGTTRDESSRMQKLGEMPAHVATLSHGFAAAHLDRL